MNQRKRKPSRIIEDSFGRYIWEDNFGRESSHCSKHNSERPCLDCSHEQHQREHDEKLRAQEVAKGNKVAIAKAPIRRMDRSNVLESK